MFFAKPGIYEPCGLYTSGHVVMLLIVLSVVGIAVYNSRNFTHNQVKKVIKISSITLVALEIIKIVFNLIIGNGGSPNNYLPLYYCSLIMYAGIFSGYAKGFLKNVGDAFLSSGAIIGGLFFLLCPTTSLPAYPAFHFISFHSFIFHGVMLYLGLLVNVTNYVELSNSRFKYYAFLICVMCAVSFVINKILGTNFMFISKNFPNTPVEVMFNSTGKWFTLIMIGIQVVGPYYVVFGIRNLIIYLRSKTEELVEEVEN